MAYEVVYIIFLKQLVVNTDLTESCEITLPIFFFHFHHQPAYIMSMNVL